MEGEEGAWVEVGDVVFFGEVACCPVGFGGGEGGLIVGGVGEEGGREEEEQCSKEWVHCMGTRGFVRRKGLQLMGGQQRMSITFGDIEGMESTTKHHLCALNALTALLRRPCRTLIDASASTCLLCSAEIPT